jgi:toxin ParE1/3/4
VTVKVRLTDGAEADLEAIHDWISVNRSPAAADALLTDLVDCAQTLATFPLRGAVPKELAALGITMFRQILLPPYRIIYQVVDDTAFIVVIADGRRDMQPLLERRLLGG